jgi:hypothetical protein
MSSSSRKEVGDIIRVCESAGWRVERGGNNHIKIYPPPHLGVEQDMIVVASTPRTSSSLRSARSILRKAGLEI